MKILPNLGYLEKCWKGITFCYTKKFGNAIGPMKKIWKGSSFLESLTGCWFNQILGKKTLNKQYEDLKESEMCDSILLFFDTCLFDQPMLCHILTCAKSFKLKKVKLLCIDSFPTISPYHGIDQLFPEQIVFVYNRSKILTNIQ